jgi:flagellar FliL protein
MARLTRRRLLYTLGAAGAATAVPGCLFGGGAATTARSGADGHAPAKAAAAGGHAADDAHGGQAGELWASGGGDDLLKGQTFQTLFNGLPNRGRALELKDTHLRCIDEGCPGGLHMAGSGCLYEKAAEDLKGRISGIYTHDGCGAAKLYVESKQIKTDDPDAVADAEAKKLAAKLGVPFLGRIKAAQMTRPPALHDARALYYDGTGKLDPSQLPGLPKGFVVSRKHISDPGYALTESEVAIGIARGDHGFGELFTPAAPFYLVAVGGTPDSVPLQLMAGELKGLAEHFDDVAVQTLDVGPAGAQADPARSVIRQTGGSAAPAKPAAAAGGGPTPAKPGAADAHAPAKAGAADAHAPARQAGGSASGSSAASGGPTYLMKDRIVNLADPGGRRYLRFSTAIEFAPLVTGGKLDGEKEFQAAIRRLGPAVEDAVVTVLSARTFDEVRTTEGKEQSKREIRARAQVGLGGALTVTNVYFTEFVVQ